MKPLGIMLIIGMHLSLVAIAFKVMLLEGSGLILTVGLLFASIISFIQFFVSLAVIKTNKMLKVIGALMSYTFSMAFIGIMFRFQYWEGSGLILLVSTLMLVVLTIIVILNRKQLFTYEYKSIIRLNYFPSWCYVCFFIMIHHFMPAEVFYNTFSTKRATVSYQQMIEDWKSAEVKSQAQQ